MKKIVTAVVLQAASAASILGLYYALYPSLPNRPWWHFALIAVGVLLPSILVGWDIVDYVKQKEKRFRDPAKINQYMHDWVSRAGRVVIFSRDLSWASGNDTRELLRLKSARGELTLCVENEIEISNYLKNRGARVITYGQFCHVPRSRFTIVDYGREGARVAVGVRVGDDHVIQEFRSGYDPFFAVAEDLVKILEGANGQGQP